MANLVLEKCEKLPLPLDIVPADHPDFRAAMICHRLSLGSIDNEFRHLFPVNQDGQPDFARTEDVAASQQLDEILDFRELRLDVQDSPQELMNRGERIATELLSRMSGRKRDHIRLDYYPSNGGKDHESVAAPGIPKYYEQFDKTKTKLYCDENFTHAALISIVRFANAAQRFAYDPALAARYFETAKHIVDHIHARQWHDTTSPLWLHHTYQPGATLEYVAESWLKFKENGRRSDVGHKRPMHANGLAVYARLLLLMRDFFLETGRGDDAREYLKRVENIRYYLSQSIEMYEINFKYYAMWRYVADDAARIEDPKHAFGVVELLLDLRSRGLAHPDFRDEKLAALFKTVMDLSFRTRENDWVLKCNYDNTSRVGKDRFSELCKNRNFRMVCRTNPVWFEKLRLEHCSRATDLRTASDCDK